MNIRELSDWDYDYVVQLAKSGTGEADWYDFKKDFPPSQNVTDTICSFANTNGGYFILGVGNPDRKNFTIKGIANNTELTHILRQKVHADPYIYFSEPKIIPIPNSEKVIAVFYIPISNDRPHLPSQKERRVFWKRTNGGKEQMTYLEIRTAFMNYEERKEKVKLLYIELITNRDILDIIRSSSSSLGYQPITLEYNTLSSLLTELYSVIGKDDDLIQRLISIRFRFNKINNKINIFLTQMALPLTNLPKIISEHNDWIKQEIDQVIPLIEECLENLKNKYNIKIRR